MLLVINYPFKQKNKCVNKLLLTLDLRALQSKYSMSYCFKVSTLIGNPHLFYEFIKAFLFQNSWLIGFSKTHTTFKHARFIKTSK